MNALLLLLLSESDCNPHPNFISVNTVTHRCWRPCAHQELNVQAQVSKQVFVTSSVLEPLQSWLLKPRMQLARVKWPYRGSHGYGTLSLSTLAMHLGQPRQACGCKSPASASPGCPTTGAPPLKVTRSDSANNRHTRESALPHSANRSRDCATSALTDSVLGAWRQNSRNLPCQVALLKLCLLRDSPQVACQMCRGLAFSTARHLRVWRPAAAISTRTVSLPATQWMISEILQRRRCFRGAVDAHESCAVHAS